MLYNRYCLTGHTTDAKGLSAVRLVALTLAVLTATACGSLRPPDHSQDGPATATGAQALPIPVQATPQALVTPAPGRAIYAGRVIAGDTWLPIPDALVRLSPFAVEMRTDSGGTFEFRDLDVGPTCRWATIEVTKAGYGRLRRIDEPFEPTRLTATLTLERQNVEVFVGPPRSQASGGESYCVR